MTASKRWRSCAAPNAPSLAILDWMMPKLDGPDVCRLVRSDAPGSHRYLILLTSRDAREDVVGGLEAGADDYLVKPCHQGELLARVSVGARVLALQEGLAARVDELQLALSQGEASERPAPDLLLLQEHPVGRQLLAAGRYVPHAAQRRAASRTASVRPAMTVLSKELDEYAKNGPPTHAAIDLAAARTCGTMSDAAEMTTPAGHAGLRVCVFELAGQSFGLPLESVREIVPMAALSRPPSMPSILEGFLNLRGTALPVLRIAALLGLPQDRAGAAHAARDSSRRTAAAGAARGPRHRHRRRSRLTACCRLRSPIRSTAASTAG